MVFNFKATKSKILGSWLDVGIFRIMTVSSLFLFFRYLYELKGSYLKRFLQKGIIKKTILSISRASYGMYLSESIISKIISPFFIALPTSGTEICLTIVLLTGVIFISSWVVVLVLSRIPVLKIFSGYY